MQSMASQYSKLLLKSITLRDLVTRQSSNSQMKTNMKFESLLKSPELRKRFSILLHHQSTVMNLSNKDCA